MKFDVISYLSKEFNVNLSQQQREAVISDSDKILLQAVPGAGKTTVLTAKIAYYIHQMGIAPQDILILTFSRDAAKDMGGRWDLFFRDIPGDKPKFSTIHSFCYSVLKIYARDKGSEVPRLFSGEASRNKILREIYNHLNHEYLKDEDLADLTAQISYCTNMMIDFQKDKFESDIKSFEKIYSEYKSWKSKNKYMDFDDMLFYAYHALSRYSKLREQFKSQYKYIFVDEVQDTTRLQQEIIGLLVEEHIFMVGDEDQSIYGFRGAFPDGIQDFFKKYTDGKLMLLEENYRSTQTIIETASNVIVRNENRIKKNMVTSHQKGEEIFLVRDISQEDQYSEIVKLAKKKMETGSCAVLYRNSFTAIGLAMACKRANVPYITRESMINFGWDFIARDIMNILRLVKDPSDSVVFNRVYFRIGAGISREMAQRGCNSGASDILAWLVDDSSEYNKFTGKLLYTQRIIKKMQNMSPIKQVNCILKELGYWETLEKTDSMGNKNTSYIQRIVIIKDIAKSCSNIDDFIEQISVAHDVLAKSDSSGIKLSTIHSAKGQEYDHVIIADVLDGIMPTAESLDFNAVGKKGNIEEELRIFYTAITRGKSTVSIFAPSVSDDIDLRHSRFLEYAKLISSPSGMIGSTVSHAFFGIGNINSVDKTRNLVEINFNHYGKKKFSMETLKDKSLFSVVE